MKKKKRKILGNGKSVLLKGIGKLDMEWQTTTGCIMNGVKDKKYQ